MWALLSLHRWKKSLSKWPKRSIGQKASLFREMVRVYRSYRKRHPEPEIDDEWVMQVIREAQEEEKRNSMTDEEFLREFRELAQYGAGQAKKWGLTSKMTK
jgi:hypothetical protein